MKGLYQELGRCELAAERESVRDACRRERLRMRERIFEAICYGGMDAPDTQLFAPIKERITLVLDALKRDA